MKAAAFDYIRTESVAQTCALLCLNGDQNTEPKILAGGQTLVPLMVMRLSQPTLLIDINGINELTGINFDGTALEIGALTRQRAAEQSALVSEKLPLLAAALPYVGHQQTRNRGTLGGSIVHGDPSAEIPLVAMLLDASLVLQSVRGQRIASARSFFEGPMMTAIEPDECLVRIRFPLPEPPSSVGVAFDEVAPRKGDYALLSAAAQLTLDEQEHCASISLGLGGCGPTPLHIDIAQERLAGLRLEAASIESALRDLPNMLQPEQTPHASAAYRLRVAPRLLCRTILKAAACAMEQKH